MADSDLLDFVRMNDEDDELVELLECCRDIERCRADDVADDDIGGRLLLDEGRAVITGGR